MSLDQLEAFVETEFEGQRRRVWEVMADGRWRTYGEIQIAILIRFGTLDSEGGIGARLRDFRKDEYGAHTLDGRSRTGRLNEWRVVPNERGW